MKLCGKINYVESFFSLTVSGIFRLMLKPNIYLSKNAQLKQWTSEVLFRNFQSLVCYGLMQKLSVAEFSNTFCYSVPTPFLDTVNHKSHYNV
jgi:hypothetical protein